MYSKFLEAVIGLSLHCLQAPVGAEEVEILRVVGQSLTLTYKSERLLTS